MIGTFTYKKNPNGGWNVYYQSRVRKDTAPRLLCAIEKAPEGGWVIPMPNKPMGPYKDRWHAGLAYLEMLNTPVAEKIEQEVELAWRKNHKYRPDRTLTEEQAGAIYDVLIERCKAPSRVSGERDNFIHHQTQGRIPDEWRFGGILGYGGKFWNTSYKWYVSAYSEDTDVETRLVIAETNEVLQQMYLVAFGEPSALELGST